MQYFISEDIFCFCSLYYIVHYTLYIIHYTLYIMYLQWWFPLSTFTYTQRKMLWDDLCQYLSLRNGVVAAAKAALLYLWLCLRLWLWLWFEMHGFMNSTNLVETFSTEKLSMKSTVISIGYKETLFSSKGSNAS